MRLQKFNQIFKKLFFFSALQQLGALSVSLPTEQQQYLLETRSRVFVEVQDGKEIGGNRKIALRLTVG